VDVAGTAAVFAATTASFRPDRREKVLGVGRSATPGLWHPYAYINGGGLNLEWFRGWIGGAGQAKGAGAPLTALDRRAAAADPGGAPLFVPHLGGRVSPPRPALRGAWVGLTWDHGVGDLYRAVLEGVALEYAIYKRVLATLYPRTTLRELRITGGGERSAVWNRIKADTLNMPVRRIARSHGAPMGAALVAALGVGLVKSLPAAAERWINVGRAVRPDARGAAAAAARVERYAHFLNALEQVSETGRQP
jgi:xylulokinase